MRPNYFLPLLLLSSAEALKCYDTCFGENCKTEKCRKEGTTGSLNGVGNQVCSKSEKQGLPINEKKVELTITRPVYIISDCPTDAVHCVLSEFNAEQGGDLGQALITTPSGCLSDFSLEVSDVEEFWRRSETNVFICNNDLCNQPSVKNCRGNSTSCEISNDVEFNQSFGNMVRGNNPPQENPEEECINNNFIQLVTSEEDCIDGWPTILEGCSLSGDIVNCPAPEPSTAPTVSPTKHPTVSPTPKPTASPTPKPTASPTPKPSTSPIVSPTKNPTVSPTKNPTVSPTPKTSTAPTVSPTKNPTVSPTPTTSTAPTVSPTKNPTVSPTKNPTVGPTPKPSTAPTVSPTKIPTVDLALAPSTDLPQDDSNNSDVNSVILVVSGAVAAIVLMGCLATAFLAGSRRSASKRDREEMVFAAIALGPDESHPTERTANRTNAVNNANASGSDSHASSDEYDYFNRPVVLSEIELKELEADEEEDESNILRASLVEALSI